MKKSLLFFEGQSRQPKVKMALNLDQQLIEAATNGNLENVENLLGQGADIHAADRYGPDAAVRRAAKRDHLLVVCFLFKKGADIRAVRDYAVRGAARWGHLGVVRFLTENGANIHAAGPSGPDDALRMATGWGHLDVVSFLLNPRRYGVDKNGCDRNILAQCHPKVLVQIQQLEQQELYQNARVMYYALSFAQQNQYTKRSRGALIQALDISL